MSPNTKIAAPEIAQSEKCCLGKPLQHSTSHCAALSRPYTLPGTSPTSLSMIRALCIPSDPRWRLTLRAPAASEMCADPVQPLGGPG